MKLFTSRVVFYAFISVFACAQIASATTPEADFKTVTSKAYVDSLIDGVDISSHTVNGLALSNENIRFYATETSGGAGNTTKTVQLAAGELASDATVIPTGMIIVIKPAANSTVAPTTLKLKRTSSDSTGISKPLRYNGAAITSDLASTIWSVNNPSVWAYDGTNWNFVSGGKDTGVDLSSHRVNGAPLSTSSIVFAGKSDSRDNEADKTVTIDGIDSLTNGLMVTITPSETSTVANNTLTVNSLARKSLFYQNAALTATTAPLVWRANVPSTWVYDKSANSNNGAWRYVGGQPVITKSTSSGVTELVAKPASTGTDGVIQTLTLDTNSLYISDDSHVPSSKLVSDSLELKLNKSNVLSITHTGDAIANGDVAIPAPLSSWGADNNKLALDDGNQLFWVSYAGENGDSDASQLITNWDKKPNVPTMSEVSNALYGYWLTREKTKEWQDVAIYYRVKDASNLYTLGRLINHDDPTTIDLVKSAYLDTYAPTLSALMDEAVALAEYADNAASNAASNVQLWAQTNRQITIPAAGSYYTSNSASGSPTAIYNSTSSTPNYTTASVKGSALVTKTGTAGVVGERKIIDADTDITNTTTWPQGKVDVSIPSMGRINNIAQAKKQCYDWKPGTEHVDANCWLWELPDSI